VGESLAAAAHPRRSSEASYETRDTSSLASKPRIKLEVLRASDIKGVHLLLSSSIGLGGAYLLVVIILVNTAFLRLTRLRNEAGVWEMVREPAPPLAFSITEVVGMVVFFVVPLAVAVVFALRIVRLRRADRTQEQVWVLFLYLTTLLYINPFYEIVFLLRDASKPDEDPLGAVSGWASEWAFTSTVFVAYSYFYVWVSVHSYRIMRGRLRWFFYAPKLLVLSLFVALRVLVGVYANIYLGYLPFVSLVSALMLLKGELIRRIADLALVLLITAYELGLVLWLAYEVSLTRKALASTSYMRYRSKQIGFRFFLYHVVSCYGSLFLFNVLLVVTYPSEPTRLVQERLGIQFLGAQPGVLASNIILVVFLAQESWVNLPADAYGLRGWFAPPRETGDQRLDAAGRLIPAHLHPARNRPVAVEEMFTYRQREPSPGRYLSPRCLVMDTTVLMFNMAWIAYSYGTPRKRPRLPADYGFPDHVVARYAIGRRTDTHALVIDAPDRIIVAFKGSTNLADLRTDISVVTVDVETLLVVPLTGAGGAAGAAAARVGTGAWEGAGPSAAAAVAAAAASEAGEEGAGDTGGGWTAPSSGTTPETGSTLVNTASTPSGVGCDPASPPSAASTGSRHLRDAMRKANRLTRACDSFLGRATVHTGFSTAYLSVRREVVETVMALYRDRRRPIHLTGHSLGGALATLCSYDLASRVASPTTE
ncbi:hypothetical protein BU14_2155s0002, partial [Porphyra umbilicalis]